jgi:hypothetical protein
MGYMSVATIEYDGVTHTIYVGSDPTLANQSWEIQKARYFSDYTGPPPLGLSKSKPNGGAPQEKIEAT